MEMMRHNMEDLAQTLHDPIELAHLFINSQINYEAMSSQDPDYAPDQSPWDEFVESMIQATKTKMDKNQKITDTATNMFLTILAAVS